MAYFLKNRRLDSAGSAVIVPSGTTALRPASPINGTMRYNSDTSRFEIYYNGWKDIAINGTVTITKDSFTGDGTTNTFTLSKTPPATNAITVFVGNVYQNPGVSFTLAPANITFTSTPPNGQGIEVFHGFNSTDAN